MATVITVPKKRIPEDMKLVVTSLTLQCFEKIINRCNTGLLRIDQNMSRIFENVYTFNRCEISLKRYPTLFCE